MSVVEYVFPDDRLVSHRAAVPVFALANPSDPLPEPRAFYRASASGDRFAFTFIRWHDGTYRAYIREQPSYGSRATDALSTHRNGDVLRRTYICWLPAPKSARDVLKIARHWAEKTDRYIRTGTPLHR